MKAQDAIKNSIDMASSLCQGYLADLSDKELLHRPHPDCNHINWQLGHLIVSENSILGKATEAAPPLPTGFAEKYAMDKANVDDPQLLCSKEELLRVHEQQQTALLAALAKTSEADLDKPSGMDFAPTVGQALSVAGSGHWLMHAGQWAVIRRQLGRKPLF